MGRISVLKVFWRQTFPWLGTSYLIRLVDSTDCKLFTVQRVGNILQILMCYTRLFQKAPYRKSFRLLKIETTDDSFFSIALFFCSSNAHNVRYVQEPYSGAQSREISKSVTFEIAMIVGKDAVEKFL